MVSALTSARASSLTSTPPNYNQERQQYDLRKKSRLNHSKLFEVSDFICSTLINGLEITSTALPSVSFL